MFFSLLAHLIPVVASPKPAVNPTHVAPDPVLTKRVKLEVPDFGKDYDGRVKKGEWLNSLFSLNDEDAKKWASPFQDSQKVFDWGWTPQAFFPENGDPDSIPVEYENKLDEAFKDPKFKVDKSNNILFYFLHDTEFKYKDGRIGKVSKDFESLDSIRRADSLHLAADGSELRQRG